ncbi:sensor histidine kinase [Granulicoccus sp. GXG6511]|uniref:sensor histidine kinase n=1 Tax=Granulicoccus sp. GXG6511 TaxID=3381351 RepID=UPI003D7DE30E
MATEPPSMREHGGVETARARGNIVAPLAMLAVSLTAAFILVALSPDLFPAANIPWFVLLTVAVAVVRVWSRRAADRTRRARAAFWVGLVLTAGLVVLNPAFGLYAFLGYPDATRQFTGRTSVVGMVAVAAVVAVAQTGGVRSPIFTPAIWGLFVLVNLVIAGLMAAFDRQRQRQAEAVEVANAELRRAIAHNDELQAQLIEQARDAGMNEERSRLAREIHDTIAQDLVGIIAQLGAATDAVDGVRGPAAVAVGGDPAIDDLRRRLGQVDTLARDALAEARRSVRALASPRLDSDDLPAALQRVLAAWEGATGSSARLTVTGQIRPSGNDGVALRIVQESLANVARHAEAKSVTVRLAYALTTLTVEINDDGIGFDVDAPRTGRGIAGMMERVRAADGELELRSVEGTLVTARLPGRWA